jgi:maltokinase
VNVLPAHGQDAAPPVEPLAVLDELALAGGCRVLVVRDAAGVQFTVPVTGPGTHRARPGDGVAAALVGLLGPGPARIGSFEVVRRYAAPATGEEAVTADQTNESVVVGGAAVVKWTLRPTTDPHPAPHRLAQLTAAGFTGMPRLWGLVLWHDPRRPGSEPVLLATVTDYLPGAADGWEWAVADLRAVAAGAVTPPDDTAAAEEMGRLTAALHLGLAGSGTRPATQAEVAGWQARALADLERALEVVTGPEGARLSGDADRVRVRLAPLAAGAGTPVGAGHGDLHVGQVLRAGGRYLVTDFDGNPVLAPAERAAPAPAALDVAGMLQSLDHVARVVLQRTPGVDAEAVLDWVPRAQAEFLLAYRSRLDAAGRGHLLDTRLLGAFRVQQEVREHLYAVAHLPHWRYVPAAALPALLDELDERDRQDR